MRLNATRRGRTPPRSAVPAGRVARVSAVRAAGHPFSVSPAPADGADAAPRSEERSGHRPRGTPRPMRQRHPDAIRRPRRDQAQGGWRRGRRWVCRNPVARCAHDQQRSRSRGFRTHERPMTSREPHGRSATIIHATAYRHMNERDGGGDGDSSLRPRSGCRRRRRNLVASLLDRAARPLGGSGARLFRWFGRGAAGISFRGCRSLTQVGIRRRSRLGPQVRIADMWLVSRAGDAPITDQGSKLRDAGRR